jgi:hypothetical protein
VQRHRIFALLAAVALLRITWFGFAADVDKPDRRAVPSNLSQFHFARLEYPGGIPDHIKNWYTDYPAMDDHLSRGLRRFTDINVGQPALVKPADTHLSDFPMIYSVEPEQMNLGPEDIQHLRRYLAQGGFWFADDFHGDEEFQEFMNQVRRVLPEARVVELNTSHPLFHCFYDIQEIIQVTNDAIARCSSCDQWENGPSGKVAKVFAVVDDHDQILILMAWNTDLGDGLEWADDRTYPEKYAAFAAKFVTNVIVYAMSH